MAEFAPSTKWEPRGFNQSKYSLTMGLFNARFVNMDGGGESGERLNVTSEDTSIVTVSLRGPVGSNVWEWKVKGVGVSSTRLRAKLADGRDYSSPLSVKVTASNDNVVMEKAWQCSRDRLRGAVTKLENLQEAIRTASRGDNGSQPLPAASQKDMKSAVKWLHCPDFGFYPIDNSTLLGILDRAATLMRRNLALARPEMFHVPAGFHASTYGSIAAGLDCGDDFFMPDGPNCRCDVVTHELFHLLGVHHGGGSLDGATVRELVNTPDKALDSADNLAQLAAELMGSKTDACTRAGE